MRVLFRRDNGECLPRIQFRPLVLRLRWLRVCVMSAKFKDKDAIICFSNDLHEMCPKVSSLDETTYYYTDNL
jgi:hypothetical protein